MELPKVLKSKGFDAETPAKPLRSLRRLLSNEADDVVGVEDVRVDLELRSTV